MEKQTKRKIFFSVFSAFSFLVFAAVLTTSTFNFNGSQIKDQSAHYFTKTSLNELQTLNGEHKMFMNDLLNSQNSPLRAELLDANVLNANSATAQKYTGLIAYAKTSQDTSSANPKKDSIFLLEPSKELSNQQLHSLAQEYQQKIPEFVNVEVDQKAKLTDNNQSPTSSTLESTMENTQENAPADKDKTDKSVRVAVIDSGIDPTHEIFQNKKVEKGWNELSNNDDMYDDIGHGTHIAGIIERESQNVTLIPYKVVNTQDGKLSHVLAALNQAIENHANVINMSLAFDEDSYALKELIHEAAQQNIVVVAAAGNSGNSVPEYPAGYQDTISVASVDDFNEKMADSDYGNWVSVAAYGFRVLSSIPGDQYDRKSGTSQATAFVTSAVANMLLNQNNPLTLEEVKSQLKKTAPVMGNGLLSNIPIVKTGENEE